MPHHGSCHCRAIRFEKRSMPDTYGANLGCLDDFGSSAFPVAPPAAST